MHRTRPSEGSPPSILVVLPTWVGDFVMATPTLRAIRERFAGARITFLMNPNLRELVRGGDWMDEVVEWPAVGNAETPKRRNAEIGTRTRSGSDGQSLNGEWRIANGEWNSVSVRPRNSLELVRELRRRRFEWAILLPNSFRAAWIAWWSGATRRVGHARDGRSFLLTDRVAVRNRRKMRARSIGSGARADHRVASAPRSDQTGRMVVRAGSALPVRLGRYEPMPLVEYYADLAEAMGCERPGHRLELFTTADCEASVERRLSALGATDSRPLIVLSPGAKFGAAKCWPAERFAGVARRLMEEHNATVIVTCGPGEEEIARRIGVEVKEGASTPVGRKCHVLDNPLLNLGELKSLIRRCDLLICNDAGPRHIAKAFDVPVVTVFGPTHPEWTWTDYPRERIVRVDVECGPCQQRLCPLGHHQCMTDVGVDAVFEAAMSLLRERSVQDAR